MAALSADAVWEVFRWLDAGGDWRWLALLFAERHGLRCPLPFLPLVELFDRREDAFACTCTTRGPYSMFDLALAEGHAPAARRHVPPAMPREGVRKMFSRACVRGHLALAKWLATEFELTREDARAKNNEAFRWACMYGQLGVAKWLTACFELTRDDARSHANVAFREACWNGHLEVAKWLAARFDLTAEDVQAVDNEAFRGACWHGQLEVAKWLAAQFGLMRADIRSNDNEAYRGASRHGHAELVAWLSAYDS